MSGSGRSVRWIVTAMLVVTTGCWRLVDEPVFGPIDDSLYDIEIDSCGVNSMDLPRLPTDPQAYFGEPYIVGGTTPPEDADSLRGYRIPAGEGLLVTGTFTNFDTVERRFSVEMDIVHANGVLPWTIPSLLIPLAPGEMRHWFVQIMSVDGPYSPPVSCEVVDVERFRQDD